MASKYAVAYSSPAGPGDSRPTASMILEDESMHGKLAGKVIFITGASCGLGAETAKALHSTDANLILAVRDVAKGQELAQQIEEAGKGKGTINVLKLELDSLESVKSCAIEALKLSKTLNIFIANAGVMCCPEGLTKEGFETHMGVNHFGHFLLFQLLKDSLLASTTSSFPSRVLCITSLAHRLSPIIFDDLDLKKAGYQPWIAYAQSKTANIYMANEIERRYGVHGLHATSVNPGTILTNIGRHMSAKDIENFVTPELQKIIKTPEQGVATTVWAAVGREWAQKGGRLLEDCQISRPVPPADSLAPYVPGYAPYAYDEEAARKLWKVSNDLVGLPSEEK